MINADMIICDGGNQIKRYWSTNYVKPSNGVIVSGASCSQSFDFQSNRLILESWKHKKEPQQKKRRREDDMYMYDKLPGTYNLEMIDKMDMKHVSGIITYIVRLIITVGMFAAEDLKIIVCVCVCLLIYIYMVAFFLSF